MTTRKTSSLSRSNRRAVYAAFKVYRNVGSHETGKWVYQPHDFDSSFELWSEAYKTRREAVEAAWDEMNGPHHGLIENDGPWI